MSLKLVEVVVLGQVLRLNVPAEQEETGRQKIEIGKLYYTPD